MVIMSLYRLLALDMDAFKIRELRKVFNANWKFFKIFEKIEIKKLNF